MRTRTMMIITATAMVLSACSGDAETAETEETSGTEAPAATEAPVATEAPAATEAPVTTAASTTTTEAAPVGTPVDASPVIGILASYNDGGEAMFDSGSVEAHWYQWNGFYVVLYRGFDASSDTAICPGNSVNVAGQGWIFVSNSPYAGDAGDVYVGVPTLADRAAMSCDSLLYYATQIPTTEEGVLYGTLEIGDDTGFRGHTSQADTDPAATPEFEPGLAAYELPASAVDDLGVVVCG